MLVGLQRGQAVVVDEQFDASGDSGLPSDQAGVLEGAHHLVDGGWGDSEIALQVAFGRRASVDLAVGPDEGEVLALLFGETGCCWRLPVK